MTPARFDDENENSLHSSAERATAASRSTWGSVGVNLCLSAAQIRVGLAAKSQGLIADGIHSLSDLVTDFVVLFASHHSGKDADDDHHYGHHRFENAASLILGLLLLAVGGGMVYGAVLKLEAPDTIGKVDSIALWLVAVALCAKELLFRYMLAIAKRTSAIRTTLLESPGVDGVHDLHTRKMGDMIIADVHLEVDASLTVEAGHDIAVEARRRVLARHRVLNLMTHIDPWRRPDLDHEQRVPPASSEQERNEGSTSPRAIQQSQGPAQYLLKPRCRSRYQLHTPRAGA